MSQSVGAGANRSLASRVGAIGFAVVSLVAAAVIVAIWMRWMPANTQAPSWIAASGATVFLAWATLALCETRGMRPDPREVMTALFLVALAFPFNWMAFGPGDHQFTTILDGIEETVDVAETGVRLAFSPGALVIDAVLAFRLVRLMRRRIQATSSMEPATIHVEWSPPRGSGGAH